MEDIVLGLGAVAVSTVVVFAYLVVIWWLDRYEREPFVIVLFAFLWGGLGGTMLGCGLTVVLNIPFDQLVTSAYSEILFAVVTAPIAEELTKGLIFVFLLATPYLDNETDGLIYGAAAGLGFAVVENAFYFLATASAGPEIFYATLVVRTLFTALVHAISTALLGYAIGYVRHRKLLPWLWLWPLLGLSLAVINHGVWNFLAHVSGSELLGEEMAAGAMGLGMTFVFFMSAAMFIITQLSLMREQKFIGEYLQDEAQRGTLPQEHARIIPSWRTRRKDDWLPPEIPKKEYVEAATMLACRRYQLDTSAPRFHDKHRREIEKYRRKVNNLQSRRVST